MDEKKPVYKRVLIKISGEALAGDKKSGLDFGVISSVCEAVKKCLELGVEVGIVIGGGNFWRGVKDGSGKIERTRADHMGMLATVMNCLAVADVMEQHGIDVRVQTAIEMRAIAEPYIRLRAMRHLCRAARRRDRGRRDTAGQEHRRRVQRRPQGRRPRREVRRDNL